MAKGKRDNWREEARAAEVLAGKKIASLPVDPFAIAKAEGIACQKLSGAGVSGCLCGAGDSFSIFYSDSITSEGFRRFTVSHELGHWFLDGHYKRILAEGNGRHVSASGYSSDDPFERSADAFAAALLMPPGHSRSICSRVAAGLTAIETLAEKCVTSLTSTAIRYADLSEDCVVVVGSKGNRIQFAFMSDQFKRIPNLTWLKKGSGIPHGTATHKFNGDEQNVAQSRRVKSSTLMDVWFDCGGNVYATEEVVGLGPSYGLTLTVLVAEPPREPDYDDENENEEQDFENMLPSDRWRQPRED